MIEDRWTQLNEWMCPSVYQIKILVSKMFIHDRIMSNENRNRADTRRFFNKIFKCELRTVNLVSYFHSMTSLTTHETWTLLYENECCCNNTILSKFLSWVINTKNIQLQRDIFCNCAIYRNFRDHSHCLLSNLLYADFTHIKRYSRKAIPSSSYLWTENLYRMTDKCVSEVCLSQLTEIRNYELYAPSQESTVNHYI